MTLSSGTRLGPYEIVSPLGAGGMGEVYRARDARLKREVALKVLPEALAHDPERLARFQREAELLAALNHPQIAAIYGLEQAPGVSAIVMELVEGETLAERIARGPLPIDEALGIARQIADALEAAHDRGVIHRDLKPANIKITPDDTVKVLDFGLAKIADTAAAASGLSLSPTLSVQATYAGVILGTAAYMSPEQARGKPADRRADVWAFGCVLYEMLTGRQVFAGGETVSDAVALILLRDPDWSALPPATPPHIRRLLIRCLQKDVRRRLPHIAVARLEIEEGAAEGEAAPSPATTGAAAAPRRGRLLTIAALAVAAGMGATAAAGWALGYLRRAPAPLPARFSVVLPPAQPIRPSGGDVNLAISPDGSAIVYVSGPAAEGPLVVRAIDQLETVPLRGASGRRPFFSHDGTWIGYFAGAELKKVSVSGGPPLTVTRIVGSARGATWGPDNTIVFATSAPGSGLMRVSASGGEAAPLTTLTPGTQRHLDPSFVPGGRGVLFTIAAAVGEDSQVALHDLESGETRILIRGGGNAAYVSSGHLVYAALGTLRAVRFDLARLEALGEPVPVIESVRPAGGGGAQFAVAPNGTLVYEPGAGNSATVMRELVWVDRRGREEPLGAPLRPYVFARIAPDGSRVVTNVAAEENDLWMWDVARGTMSRLTFDPANDVAPVWMPDGRRVVFASERNGSLNLFWRAADGTGADERLTNSPNLQIPTSVSDDGRILLLREDSASRDIHVLPLDPPPAGGPAAAKPLIQTRFHDDAAQVSPDGRWMAYFSNESGRNEVYVRPFPNVDGGRWQISTAGGTRPAWARNGREIFYQDPSTAMMAVPVVTASAFAAGNPVKLFDGPWAIPQPGRSWDVAPDGQRFLMVRDPRPVAGAEAAPAASVLVVVLNWAEELKRVLPPQ